MRAVSVLLLATVVLATAACGGSGPPEQAGGPTVEVRHALGTAAVPADVRRIVTLGPSGLDVALALDAPVVGAAATAPGEGFAPWVAGDPRLPGVEVLDVEGESLTVDLERVAALQPDLIFAPGYFSLADSYDRLSAIAPTVGYQVGPAQDSWQQMTRQLAAALGRPVDAERVVGDVEGRLAAARDANPGLRGRSYTFAYVGGPGATTVLRDPEDTMSAVPAALGLVLAPGVLALPQGESFGVRLSNEQLRALDADVLAVSGADPAAATATLAAAPLWPTLGAVRRGAVVTYDYDEFLSLRNPSALSVPWFVDRVVPRLAAAAAR